MKIKWWYFVPKIINIGLDLLELFEHITGVRDFLRHSVHFCLTKCEQSDTRLLMDLSVLFQICCQWRWCWLEQRRLMLILSFDISAVLIFMRYCVTFVFVKMEEERQRVRHFSWHRLSECFKHCQLWFSARCKLVHSPRRTVSYDTIIAVLVSYKLVSNGLYVYLLY